jgi:hypothetical protein
LQHTKSYFANVQPLDLRIIIVVNEEARKSLKGSVSKTTALQTTKGACSKQIGASILHQYFVSTNKLNVIATRPSSNTAK